MVNIQKPIAVLLLLYFAVAASAADPPQPSKTIEVIFLGDQGHHQPASLANVITPVLAKSGINISYTDDVAKLTTDHLAKFDCVLIYRDSGDLPAKAESALLAFVDGGKGLVALHCASHCFRNSAAYTKLVGGRFDRHDGGVFRARIIDAQHPAMRGVSSFESWDETYVHNELAKDIRVLMARSHEGAYEPWTWVRSQGKGRVFYTASGHDGRTWRHEGFQRLVTAAIQWAAGRVADDEPPIELTHAAEGLPNYVAGEKWGTEAERVRRMPKPMSPADSIRRAHVAEGFSVQLFAAEPNVVKPMAMAFDERARLWVIESVDYPNNLLANPENNGNDRIKICEDTDGDGRADKFTVFADKLNIPTGLLPVKGGVLICLAPHILYLKDTDGDDRCDERTVLYTGFGRADTHAMHSNLRYGHDNWIYGCVGYSGGQVRGIKMNAPSHRFGQGLFRFKVDGSAFEFLGSTSNNTWGLAFGEHGDLFGSTANNEHSVHIAIPNRYYENVRGWHGTGTVGIDDHKRYHPIAADIRQMDWHGGFTAASCYEIYTARAFPQEYWNRAAFVCEPTGHLVHLDWLVPRGSGFVARNGFNFFASTDPWCAPVAAQVGPDGAMWIADWYNYIIQHNPTPRGFKTGPGNAYVTTLRDKQHGRILRVVHRDEPKRPTRRLERGPTPATLAALGDDNMFWRLTAQRLLVERGERDVAVQLVERMGSGATAESIRHSLFALDGLGLFHPMAPEILEQLEWLGPNEPVVTRALLSMAPGGSKRSAKWIIAEKLLASKEPLVRRDALLALAEMPGFPEAAEAIVRALRDPQTADDPWLVQAAAAAAARSDRYFFAAARATEKAETSNALARVAAVVAEHYARGGEHDDLAALLTALAAADTASADAAVAGLAKGWPKTDVKDAPKDLSVALGKLIVKLSPAGQLQLAGLAKRWGAGAQFAELTAKLTEALTETLADESKPDEARIAAAKQLVATTDDAKRLAPLLDLLTPRASPALVEGLIDALGESRSDGVAAALVDALAQLAPAARRRAIGLVLSRPSWTTALLAAMENGKAAVEDLAIDQRQQLAQHPDSALRARATKILERGGGLPNPDRQKVLDQFLPIARQRGDAAIGKKVYMDQCAKCHRHGSEGTSIGPDLTGMAAHPRAELLGHILDPNRSVEGNFRVYQVLTNDGRAVVGLLLGETRTAVELVDAEAKKQVVLREEIDRMIATRMSLMPEGFEKIGQKDLTNLLEFLSARGKYFALPLNKAANVVSTRPGMFQPGQPDYERLVFSQWGPHTVRGVPFHVIDPQGDRVPNAIVLFSPRNEVVKAYPKSVKIACNGPAKALHFLSGVSGWGFPFDRRKTVSLIVRLHYADGKAEDHELQNGVHFADFSYAADVPESKAALKLRGQQLRYFSITPRRDGEIASLELVKGDDLSAPVVMAVTVESP